MPVFKVNFTKQLHTATGLQDLKIDLELEPGSFSCLFGPSGVGKTTTLRVIAGISQPEKGFLAHGENVWLDSSCKLNLPPQKRKVGFVFQDYALFPSMNVFQNVCYGVPKGTSKESIQHLLENLGLSNLQKRNVLALSGGQQQRVALARAIAAKPELLLLDEPLSALDPSMRKSLQDLLQKIHSEYKMTILMVSHDIPEIFKLASKVFQLEGSAIVKSGSPSVAFDTFSEKGMFNILGEIIAIDTHPILSTITLCIGQEIVRVALPKSETVNLQIGQRVSLTAKESSLMLTSSIDT